MKIFRTIAKNCLFIFVVLILLMLTATCVPSTISIQDITGSTHVAKNPTVTTPSPPTLLEQRDLRNSPSQGSSLKSTRIQSFDFIPVEGFGSKTLGGRGGKVFEVTNLNENGVGSLRECVEANGPRICIFTTGGTINLGTSLIISNPYLTIAGQTAPGGGITLKPSESSSALSVLHIRTHDVIVQYLTIRAGPPIVNDAMTIASFPGENSDIYNIVVDHNSMSWGVDENLATWYDAHDITIQWNIFSEALDCSIHPKGCHSKGVMLGCAYGDEKNRDEPGARDISFHHNLIAHSAERNPLVKTYGVVDVVNNVMYNSRSSFSHVDMENQITSIPVNYVSNYFKSGPDTRKSVDYGVSVSNIGPLGAEIFVQGNIGVMRPDESYPEIEIVRPRARPYVIEEHHPTEPIMTTSAFIAYDEVLTWAGNSRAIACDGSWYERRDDIDERIISDVKTGTGHIINDLSEVGGWIDVETGKPCLDIDQDGMPDLWEVLYGLDPNDGADAALDIDQDMYTNIEEYLNGTNPAEK